jgi:cysteinyl-tRNA synthetase
MYFCSGHYHQPMDFDEERMDEAVLSVRRVREAGRKLVHGPSPAWSQPLEDQFFEALAADFNTPKALAAVFDWVREANRSSEPVGDADLREMLSVLALENLLDPEAVEVPAEAREMADARERARMARDYAEADRIRDQLRERGWEIRDSPDGPELLPLGN